MKQNKACAILHINENTDPLRPLTNVRPIGGLPFAGRYRVVDFPLSTIVNANIDTIGIQYGQGASSIYDHIRGGREWNLNTSHGGVFTFQESDNNHQLHMNDAYRHYQSFIKKSHCEYVVVLGSDGVYNVDLNDVIAFHQKNKHLLTAVYSNGMSDSVIEHKHFCFSINDMGEPIANQTKARTVPKHEKVIGLGIFVLDARVLLKLLEEAIQHDISIPLTELLQEKMFQVSSIGYEYTGYFHPIDSIENYYHANMDMLDTTYFHSLLKNHAKIYTKIKNDMPTYYSSSSFVRNSQLASGCLIEGAVSDSMLFREVTVSKAASVKDSIVMKGSKVAEGAVLQHTILDKNVSIGPNVTLIGTEEEPIVISKNQVIQN